MITMGELAAQVAAREQAARERVNVAHLGALVRAYGDGAILRVWLAEAEAGELRTANGQVGRWRDSLVVLDNGRAAAVSAAQK